MRSRWQNRFVWNDGHPQPLLGTRPTAGSSIDVRINASIKVDWMVARANRSHGQVVHVRQTPSLRAIE